MKKMKEKTKMISQQLEQQKDYVEYKEMELTKNDTGNSFSLSFSLALYLPLSLSFLFEVAFFIETIVMDSCKMCSKYCFLGHLFGFFSVTFPSKMLVIKSLCRMVCPINFVFLNSSIFINCLFSRTFSGFSLFLFCLSISHFFPYP